MADDPVVLALRAALGAGEQPAIRIALAQHLTRSGQPADALVELEVALQHDPTNLEVLALAATTAKEAGDPAKASAYEVAYNALAGSKPTEPPPAAPPPTQDPKLVTLPIDGRPGKHGEPDEDRADEDDEPDAAGAQVTRLRHLPEGGPQLQLVDDEFEVEDPGVTFANVGGLEAVKKRLDRSFLMPLRKPKIFRRFGKKIGGGLLLYGPPGCGKTFLARALAGEIGARLISVGLSDVLDMYVGESERKLHALFEMGRRHAPVVMFFDEVDAIGQRRSQLRNATSMRNVVNQLLTEMDGVDGNNDGVFVLGATNTPWDVDPAMRRPGRFDRTVFVPPPDRPARKRILELKLGERPTAGKLGLDRLAKRAEGYSGADLEAVVEYATELAIEASMERGDEVPIDTDMLFEALGDIRPSTRPWLESARNYALYANESGSWDDLAAFLKKSGLA